MKQFFLSFAAMLLLNVYVNAQTVNVVNNTGCEVEVEVYGYDATCTRTLASPSPIILPSFGSQFFSGYTEYEIRLVFDPNSSMGGPATFFMPTSAHPTGLCISSIYPQHVRGATTICGGGNGEIEVYTDNMLNATVNIDPL